MRGNCITFAQRPGAAYKKLPISRSEVSENVFVIFGGKNRPSGEELAKMNNLLVVSRSKVRNALLKLREINPDYANVEINEDNLRSLPEGEILDEIVHLDKEAEKEGAVAEEEYGLQDEILPTAIVDVNAMSVGQEEMSKSIKDRLNQSMKEQVLYYPHDSRPFVYTYLSFSHVYPYDTFVVYVYVYYSVFILVTVSVSF